MSYSTESLTYPTTMLLSMTNVTKWEHYMKNKLTAYPDMGQAKPTFNVQLPTQRSDNPHGL